MAHGDHALDYDQLAAEYARSRRIHPGVLRALIACGQLAEASRVLEVGCGTGNYICALQEATDASCWGIDPSEQMLTHARQQTELVTFASGRAESLGVPSDSFDLIFSVDVIHHVADRAQYFKEAARALRPDGLLCTATDSPEDIRRRRPLSNYFPETLEVEWVRYPPIDQLRREMEQAGFRDIEVDHVELAYDLTDIEPYGSRAYSSLHLISDDAFVRGLERLAADLRRGPIPALSLYTLVWGRGRESHGPLSRCDGLPS